MSRGSQNTALHKLTMLRNRLKFLFDCLVLQIDTITNKLVTMLQFDGSENTRVNDSRQYSGVVDMNSGTHTCLSIFALVLVKVCIIYVVFLLE